MAARAPPSRKNFPGSAAEKGRIWVSLGVCGRPKYNQVTLGVRPHPDSLLTLEEAPTGTCRNPSQAC